MSKTTAEEMLKEQAVEAGASAPGAEAEAEQVVAALEADKKSDPLPAIKAIAAVEDSARRGLLVGRLVALSIPGATRKFIEQQVRDHRNKAQLECKRAADSVKRNQLLEMNVELAVLLEEVCMFIQRFVLLSEAQAKITALWIAHTHVFGAAEYTPYLSITSPEKRSGKTRKLEVLNMLVANPWLTGRVTAAVLYRKIDAEAPTLLLDESDAAFGGEKEYAEALRGILNTGHQRGGKASCCVKQGGEIGYADFSTFCPKAIAGIGKLPDTITDRAIPIRLKRKTRSDRIEKFRPRDLRAETEQMRKRLEAFSVQNIEALQEARPESPEELSDRQQDGAEPLLAIADLAGNEWPQAARLALVELCCAAKVADDSIGTQLLLDIREIFHELGQSAAKDKDRLSSADLANRLAGIETSQWGEWSHGKPITQRGVARLLEPFEIRPHNIRLGDKPLKGYENNDFEEAFARYLTVESDATLADPPLRSATPLQAATGAGSSEFSNRYNDKRVAVQNRANLNKTQGCSGVAFQKSEIGTKGREEDL